MFVNPNSSCLFCEATELSAEQDMTRTGCDMTCRLLTTSWSLGLLLQVICSLRRILAQQAQRQQLAALELGPRSRHLPWRTSHGFMGSESPRTCQRSCRKPPGSWSTAPATLACDFFKGNPQTELRRPDLSEDFTQQKASPLMSADTGIMQITTCIINHES